MRRRWVEGVWLGGGGGWRGASGRSWRRGGGGRRQEGGGVVGAHAMALAVSAAPGFGRRSGRPGAPLQGTGVPNRSGRGCGHRSGRGPDGVRTPVRTGPGNSGGPPPPTGGGGPAGV